MVQLSNSLSVRKELHTCIVDTLNELMKKNHHIIALENTLDSLCRWSVLKKDNPKQYFNLTVDEEDIMGIAAGFSLAGYKPFIHLFDSHAMRKIFDQLFISEGYRGDTINIFGGYLTSRSESDKISQAGEDLALMAMIPHSIICEATDEVQMTWLIKEFSRMDGIHYVRGENKKLPNIYKKETAFQLGRGNIILQGTDILIIVAGRPVYEALNVAKYLKARQISCEVIDMFTIKPIDKQLILKEIKGKKQVITIENYAVIGGLSSAVASSLSESNTAIPLKKIELLKLKQQAGVPIKTDPIDLMIQLIVKTILTNYLEE
ncbi:alpha-ketoacid dehydrogenase subunit beta [Enterococcus hirae]|uniref:transketolase C-terminal domain-containing protein n=1 Tax=Enterococcus TaxID=1350 RepID=UPI000BBCBA3F|nr:transketolase C-terminal domain-containing protein [Enterococcus hirae]EMF0260452.1 alpha-ketoacid dehydrogenase subunit beta [Enterococcus hirae]EMF0287344.1 alpha-ketoacid dehydrogenase subunit beta [Enterococcus hirae]MBA5272351.1 alpha-ketoacid dehydrogenase subunit beta [Enterococcus hirae]MCC4033940.1 alpha-ketoacid dehydrogenase subunit beta [Enterococcus hirae]MDU1931477.1 transketolase C-terminal domain-containing protein [Enterococcus hirae]